MQFYVFKNIPDAKKFKNVYWSRLDELHIDKVKSDEIVKEANYVFLLNIYLIQERDALAGFEGQEPKKKKLTIIVRRRSFTALLTRQVKKPQGCVHLQPWTRSLYKQTW